MIGTFRLDQISARLAFTSAMAQFVSSGLLLANAKVKRWSMVLASSGSDGAAIGSSAATSSASTSASDLVSSVPGPHTTESASTASMHWPNVAARTATPVGTTATSVTPGMARTAAAFATLITVPLMVGGRHTMAGSAPGTTWSMAKVLRPVTMSTASTRVCGVPMTLNALVTLRVTGNDCVVVAAALTAR